MIEKEANAFRVEEFQEGIKGKQNKKNCVRKIIFFHRERRKEIDNRGVFSLKKISSRRCP